MKSQGIFAFTVEGMVAGEKDHYPINRVDVDHEASMSRLSCYTGTLMAILSNCCLKMNLYFSNHKNSQHSVILLKTGM